MGRYCALTWIRTHGIFPSPLHSPLHVTSIRYPNFTPRRREEEDRRKEEGMGHTKEHRALEDGLQSLCIGRTLVQLKIDLLTSSFNGLYRILNGCKLHSSRGLHLHNQLGEARKGGRKGEERTNRITLQ